MHKKTSYFITFITAISVFSVLSCSSSSSEDESNQTESFVPGENHKILVAYFSMPETDGVDVSSGASRVIVDGELRGNTQYIAQVIRDATQGDMFTIKTERAYPGSHTPLVNQAEEEKAAGTRPALAASIEGFENYDVIFIGYPIWWSDLPMPLYTFFDEYDFSGKTIVPFTTHGGSRWAGTVNTISGMEPGATVVQGFIVSRDNTGRAKDDVTAWLREIRVIE